MSSHKTEYTKLMYVCGLCVVLLMLEVFLPSSFYSSYPWIENIVIAMVFLIIAIFLLCFSRMGYLFYVMWRAREVRSHQGKE